MSFYGQIRPDGCPMEDMSNSGHNPESAPMDTLVTALASRASTLRQLAELTLTSPDEIRDRLDALERLGYLEVTGERISYRSPKR